MGEQLMRDIVTPGVIGVAPDASMAEAMEVMRSNRISCIVILKDRRPVGILTERNILESVARWGRSFVQNRVSGLMSSPVVTVTGDAHVYEAYQLLMRHKMRHLIVVDAAGEAVAVATLSNLVATLEHAHVSGVKTIAQIMNQVIITAPRECLVLDALRLMADRSVSSAVVVEDERPVGILTERDVVSLIALELDLAKLTLGDVMSKPVRTVHDDTPAHEVAARMRSEHVRRLVVVNGHGRITGLITQSDIVRGLESNYLKILKKFLFEREDRLAEAGDELRQKTIYLENVLRSSEVGIVTTDARLRVTSFNPAAEDIFRTAANKVLGRALSDVHKDWGLAPGRFGKVLQLLEPRSSHEFEFRLDPHPDHGEEGVVQGRVSGVWNNDETLAGYLLMVTDVTEQRRAEENLAQMNVHLEHLVDERTRDLNRKARQLELANVRLRDMDRLKSDFLSAVSHELRTPLTSLLGFAKLVARDFDRHFAPAAATAVGLEHRAERIRDNLHIMGLESERLARLINNYLDLAKIESGHLEWQDAPLDMARAVERAIDSVAGQYADNPAVALETDVAPDLPPVVADPDRIHQVLINLLSNAAKFTALGRVLVSAAAESGSVVLQVADTGSGIPEQDLSHVFDKYRQAARQQDTLREPRQGTGLGLAICKEIVEHYRGSITVASTYGQGATFTVRLPAA